jgi:hypothetical protein
MDLVGGTWRRLAGDSVRGVTSLSELVRLAPPPPAPVSPGTAEEWSGLESELGLTLPDDFKQLVQAYGEGVFCDFLYTFPRTEPFGGMSLLLNQGVVAGHAEARQEAPEDYPYPLYPEPGGLFIWGGTINGDTLCWLTAGDPSTWPVVVWVQRGAEWAQFGPGTAAFIHTWMTGQLDTDVMLTRSPGEPMWFDAQRELVHVYVSISEGTRPFDETLANLKASLGPTFDRDSYVDAGGDRQEEFTVGSGWRIMLEAARQYQIRVEFPAEDDDAAGAAIRDAVRAMGCEYPSARTIWGWSSWGGGKGSCER